MINRRQAIKAAAISIAAIATSRTILAQSIINGRFEPLFLLPPLPFSLDALEPHIDSRTIEIHHNLHHGVYVTQLNDAISSIPDLYFELKTKGTEASLERLLKEPNSIPQKIRTAVRNHGGGHYNHSLFWQMMKRNGGGVPQGDLAVAIDKTFGSFGRFKEEFTKAALGQFGSGWAWLTLDGGTLKVEATANQDTPLSAGRPVLLGLDVWEHAYYLKYQNRRADYVAAWFNVVNWDFVTERYQKLKG